MKRKKKEEKDVNLLITDYNEVRKCEEISERENERESEKKKKKRIASSVESFSSIEQLVK